MDYDLLLKALKEDEKGRSCAFATIVDSTVKGTPRKTGAKMVVFADGSSSGSIGGGRNEKDAQKRCLKAMKNSVPETVTYNYFGNRSESICGGQIKVFIEPFVGAKHLIICGAGHIALPLSMIAKMLNFKVTIVDNRKALANKKRFPHVNRIVVGNHARKLKKEHIDHNTFVMIVTQGNEYDLQCLKAVVKKKGGYLGVISSKAKRVKFLKELKEMNVSPGDLSRIRMPAGVDIGGQTPEEIAVSIAAELVQFNNKELTGTDKFKA